MSRPYPPVDYTGYLKVDQLTQLQKPKGEEYGTPVHDEMLFIVIHQVYELWFKQILFELDSVLEIFSRDRIAEQDMLHCSSRLERIIEIQKILVDQVKVLETMTPMDFLEFRDFLVPASGFQSAQFRQIENKLGLINRLTYNNKDYIESLCPMQQPTVRATESEPSLFTLLEKWLERTPLISDGSFDFWKSYKEAVEARQKDSREAIKTAGLDKATESSHLKNLEHMERSFESIFDKNEYEKLQKEGHWRLSRKALSAALIIHLYREEPLLQAPFRLLTQLQNVDENFTQWRHRHAQMAHRMLGAKMGTGGSSGHKYLRAAGERHKVFSDFFNLATFFIPKSHLPEIPQSLKAKIQFRY